jgi:hypothetical protein
VGGNLQHSLFGPTRVSIVSMQTGLGHCRDKLSAVYEGQDGEEMVSKLSTGKRNGGACAALS